VSVLLSHVQCSACAVAMSCSGNSANDVHFQSYLLEGIRRWNDDRATAALASSGGDDRSFCDVLKEAANHLSEKVLGHKVDSSFRPAKLYTGTDTLLLLGSLVVYILDLSYLVSIMF